jgi:stage V sporulation protein SpoVS
MAGVIRQVGAVEVQVVGAGALNQAVKAVAIARGYPEPPLPAAGTVPHTLRDHTGSQHPRLPLGRISI